MANDRRVARVAASIKREIAQMLMSGIKDERVGTGMVSVTDVEVSGDLQHAKVFVSFYGTEDARAAAMDGLQASQGYVRKEIGRRVRLRRTPTIAFYEDRSLERGTQVLSLLNKLHAERQRRGETPSAPDSPPAAE
ncbi:30S ribosome-binding factor RbfA [Synechococcus sp. PCC 7336]|uniref:30S ribosome-binding factor RbfA n=1 Tax=Synechococcus sp. PCC 7336 TaxID=195250 RepID=UPI000475CD9F|nr:30S ribosome-binding factor RbfA [Synechococcus sp. PCC 7336]